MTCPCGKGDSLETCCGPFIDGTKRPATAEDLMRSRYSAFATHNVDYILDTFPIVRRKDFAAYGEYRTKRVILELFDAMQKAIDTGIPYQTILDPPPGHGPRRAPSAPAARSREVNHD